MFTNGKNNTISVESYELEFMTNPPFSGVRQTNVNAQSAAILQLGIEKWLQKGAIGPVPPATMEIVFIQHDL